MTAYDFIQLNGIALILIHFLYIFVLWKETVIRPENQGDKGAHMAQIWASTFIEFAPFEVSHRGTPKIQTRLETMKCIPCNFCRKPAE